MGEPEGLGPASDFLEEHFSVEVAEYLRAAPARLAPLERAVAFLERVTRLDGLPMSPRRADDLRAVRRAIIAEHRGHSREEFAAETAPAPTVPGVEFTEDEARHARYIRTGRADP